MEKLDLTTVDHAIEKLFETDKAFRLLIGPADEFDALETDTVSGSLSGDDWAAAFAIAKYLGLTVEYYADVLTLMDQALEGRGFCRFDRRADHNAEHARSLASQQMLAGEPWSLPTGPRRTRRAVN